MTSVLTLTSILIVAVRGAMVAAKVFIDAPVIEFEVIYEPAPRRRVVVFHCAEGRRACRHRIRVR